MNDARQPEKDDQGQPLSPDVFAQFNRPGEQAKKTMHGVNRLRRQQTGALIGAAFSCLLIAIPVLIWARGFDVVRANQDRLLMFVLFGAALGLREALEYLRFLALPRWLRPGFPLKTMLLTSLGGAILLGTVCLFVIVFFGNQGETLQTEKFRLALFGALAAIILCTLAGWFLGGRTTKDGSEEGERGQ